MGSLTVQNCSDEDLEKVYREGIERQKGRVVENGLVTL